MRSIVEGVAALKIPLDQLHVVDRDRLRLHMEDEDQDRDHLVIDFMMTNE